MNHFLTKIEKYVLYLTVFLLPIAILPISPNLFTPGRLAILGLGVATIILIKAIRVVLIGKLEFNLGDLDFPVLFLALSFLVSAIFKTPNKMEAFLLPGSATAFIGGALLYFLINQVDPSQKKSLLGVLLVSGTVFSLIILLAVFGILSKIPVLPLGIRNVNFTPDGGYLPVAIFLATLFPLSVGFFLGEKEIIKKALSVIFFFLALVPFSISIYQMLPGKAYTPRSPSFSVTWNVAIDVLKESPILGIGPGNYLTAFSRFRPISYNATDLWPIRYTSGRSLYLTVLTEVGLLGLAALVIILIAIYRFVKRNMKDTSRSTFKDNPVVFSLFLYLVLMAFFPATTLLTVLLFILLALFSKTSQTSLNLTTMGTAGTASKFPALLISLPVIAAVALFGYYMGRILIAEYTFKGAMDALARTEGQATYDKMRQAIVTNPYVDRYHSSFSQINLVIARNLARKQDLSDTDRATLTQLVQQSINEAKAAVALNPQRASSWEVLALTYRAIIPLANNADAFALQVYSQAIALDPMNPNLRISLGSLYYNLKDYDTAVSVLELAVAVKPDLTNSHYNLAFAYREKGELDKAINQMSLVLSLIKDTNSKDYEIAKTELENLQAKKASEPGSGESLTPPAAEEGPAVVPPLELPEGSQPPEGEASPTPAPGQ
ncbi:hypothetical protein A2V56_00770 [Candidatus Woesebacteria bacterium RBG_19FT_COMBO_42_9]|uniref:Uncharacterized protein n=1 Tax=Candidatus Woesebacteria bacterium RBG_16_42_24 TaxID=1802485 RepID=A0A1F7XKD7_9BACT|nr:MAG: hypothetical protein A2V97_00630 [Candidatus Woesebacteria bacterium RBG_16_42_24]OGM16568.1 MAG: hypothetical protein A2V56_00770 [Candidatus Woesebacteria bacterium RBG_19FT_COMBO_42_9]